MIGARSPACCATSTKRAWKGRPEGADRGNGFALCVEMPCVRSKLLPSENPAPNPNCANLRRVIFTARCPRGNTCAHWTDPYRFASVATYNISGKRSEEHTSELQSPCNLVCRLLLEKKKKYKYR